MAHGILDVAECNTGVEGGGGVGVPGGVWADPVGGGDAGVVGQAAEQSPGGRAVQRPYLTCQAGGLVLVPHDAEAVARLVEVAETAYRVAGALWPVEASMAAQAEADELAERRVRERAGR